MHAGLDEQAEDGYSLDALLSAGKAAEVPFSVAGGVSADSVEAVQRAGADVAVAGSAIYSASDVAAAAAIAAGGPAELDELLAPERNAAVAAVAGADIDLGLVEEFHGL